MNKLFALTLLLGFTFVLSGCSGKTEKPAEPINTPLTATPAETDFPLGDLREASLSIDGMWCASCAVGIEYNLKLIPGVTDAKIGFREGMEGQGKVVYNPAIVSQFDIQKAAEPYTAIIVDDGPATTKVLTSFK